jgi:aminocarboxymuconate-semialdehyde decarboxylase
MDAQHVTHQVVAPWLDVQGQELAATDGAVWCALLNDHLAATVAASPWLSAHATVHLGNPDSAADELNRAVERLGMRSVMVPCTLPEGRLSDRTFDPFWARAVELQIPVVLHATTRSPAADLLAQFPALRGIFGRHIETSLVTAELMVTGVLDRFPGLRIVNVHGGGILPYQLGRLDQDLSGSMSRLPSDVLRTMYFDTVLLTASALGYLVDVVGADRVVLGSDFGATPAERAGVSVTAPVLELGPELSGAVLAGNARELYGLDQSD